MPRLTLLTSGLAAFTAGIAVMAHDPLPVAAALLFLAAALTFRQVDQ